MGKKKSSSLLSFWQRKAGEPLLSAQNIAKGLAVVLGYGLASKKLPKDSKIANATALGAASALLGMLAIPKKEDLSDAKFFELIFLVEKHFPESSAEFMKWLSERSVSEKDRLASIYFAMKASSRNPEEVVALFTKVEFRANLLTLIKDKEGFSLGDILSSERIEKIDSEATELIRAVRKELPWLKK